MIGRPLLCVVVALVACGGSNNAQIDAAKGSGSGSGSGSGNGSGNGSGSGSGGVYDFGCGGNTACPLDKVCCAAPGTPTTFSCVAPSACPAADKIVCDGPDECGGTTPVCCGVDVNNGTGQYPNCGATSLGTSCTSASGCPTHFASSCTDTTKVQICHVSSECPDHANPMCCTFTSNASTITFCTDAATATLGNGVCH